MQTKAGLKKITLALAGNPNCGKTTVFNSFTGSRQHCGNWPGVTVEKKEGRLSKDGFDIKVVDLPGIYSIGAHSQDEVIARDYILFEKPDVVVNIVDSTNLERNLYLTVQLLEMGVNVVLALNMFDESEAKKIDIDLERLSRVLGVPVVPTIATKGKGIEELLQKCIQAAEGPQAGPLRIPYPRSIESHIKELEHLIANDHNMGEGFDSRWLSIKLLEEDEEIISVLKSRGGHNVIKKAVSSAQVLLDPSGEDAQSMIAEYRYNHIAKLIREAVRYQHHDTARLSASDKIDRVVTNKFLGIPIFLGVMFAIFTLTFRLGAPLVSWIETFFEWLGVNAAAGLEAIASPAILNSLLVDGILAGVGSVLVFLPNIFILFICISLLEDSGYLARAAYIVDRFMNALGLHGKSFIPLLIGFGCNVPAVMATRTLDNKNDRLITILINPLMSCSARLPVYVLFAGAFFPARQGLVVFSLYLLGIILAVLIGLLLKKFIFKGHSSHFIMELPPYRIPTIKSTFIHVWERGSMFIKRAGTLILLVVILIWALSYLPVGVEYASNESILGRIGGFIAPVFGPAGFGTWEASVSLMFGVVAKEVVVGTLGVIYGVGEEGLGSVIANYWTPLSAYAFMIMTLLYIPCVAVIGTIRRETNSWGWTGFVILYTLVLGWTVATLFYQAGRLLGFA
jgi:ferrous iron transport protein B